MALLCTKVNQHSMRISVILLIICLSSCNSVSEKTNKEREIVQVNTLQSFPIPEIPLMYTTEELRKEFLTLYYWNAYDFTDSTLVNNANITEQGLANYLSLLMNNDITLEKLQKSLNNFCRSMEKSDVARKKIMDLVDKYLYDPNSPMYNEKVYACFLQTMIDSPLLTKVHKDGLRFTLELIGRNSIGKKASQFNYTLSNGQSLSLYQTSINKRLLLIFYDPECPHCHEIIQQIANDKELAEFVSAKKLNVLAIYTEDNQESWEKDLPNMPKGWIVGTDKGQIKNEALYDLKAMPSLYLLDKNKYVLLKDAPYSIIQNYLKKIIN